MTNPLSPIWDNSSVRNGPTNSHTYTVIMKDEVGEVVESIQVTRGELRAIAAADDRPPEGVAIFIKWSNYFIAVVGAVCALAALMFGLKVMDLLAANGDWTGALLMGAATVAATASCAFGACLALKRNGGGDDGFDGGELSSPFFYFGIQAFRVPMHSSIDQSVIS